MGIVYFENGLSLSYNASVCAILSPDLISTNFGVKRVRFFRYLSLLPIGHCVHSSNCRRSALPPMRRPFGKSWRAFRDVTSSTLAAACVGCSHLSEKFLPSISKNCLFLGFIYSVSSLPVLLFFHFPPLPRLDLLLWSAIRDTSNRRSVSVSPAKSPVRWCGLLLFVHVGSPPPPCCGMTASWPIEISSEPD